MRAFFEVSFGHIFRKSQSVDLAWVSGLSESFLIFATQARATPTTRRGDL